MIIKGSNKINNYKFGDNQVDKIFKGEVQVFPDIMPSGIVSKTNITSGYFDSFGNDKDGNLFICSKNNSGIYKINDDGDAEFTNITNGLYSYFFNDYDGNLYVNKVVSDETGEMLVYKLNYENNEFEPFSTNDLGTVKNHIISPNGTLYVNDYFSLWKLDKVQNKFVKINNEGSPRAKYEGSFVVSNKTNNLYLIGAKDDSNNATVNGIWKINESDNVISEVMKTDSPVVTLSYLIQTNDSIYINQHNSSVKILNESTKKLASTNITNIDFNIAKTNANDIPYFSSKYSSGLYKLNKSTSNIISTNLIEDTITTMLIASDGKLYFGGDSLYKEENGSILRLDINSDIFLLSCYCLGNHKDGTLYIGSWGYGIFKVVF